MLAAEKGAMFSCHSNEKVYEPVRDGGQHGWLGACCLLLTA